ncbi:MAG: hypothetical protein ABFC71_06865 [Methanoregula sp.]
MTECLTSEDDDEGNQRRFAFSFATMSCPTGAGAGIRIIDHVFFRFSRPAYGWRESAGRPAAINSSANGSLRGPGGLMTR